jgi:hypothetical protein
MAVVQAAQAKAAATSVGFIAATLSFIFGCFKLFLISLSVGTGLVLPGIIAHRYLKSMKHEAHHKNDQP